MKTRNYLKYFWRVLFICLATFVVSNFEIIKYGVQQLYYQTQILNNAIPIEQVLRNEEFPDSLKQKIYLIQEIKKFAFEKLGLMPSKSYTTFFDQEGKPLLWNLTACQKYHLKPKTWTYPIFGKFSYKGFFSKKDLVEEQKILEEEGWETSVRNVNAWSTLGILKDPILSNFLYRTESNLASLIIHELTHGTVFIKSNLSFNENFASFVAQEGVALFLETKYGMNSKQVNEYKSHIKDKKIFYSFLKETTVSLDSLYNSFSLATLEEDKAFLKKQKIQLIINKSKDLDIKSNYYIHYFDDFTPTNNFFISFLRYNGQQSQFQEERNQYTSLRNYINFMKKIHKPIF